MRRAGVALLIGVAVTVAVLPVVAAASSASAAVPGSAVRDAVSVQVDPTTVSIRIGQSFRFTSTVRNDGDQPMPDAIAHLNVLSPDPAVYVDPEDWSSRRTQYLDTFPAHSSVRLTWNVQAVNSGRFVLYVAVSGKPGTDEVTASNALRLFAAQKRTINASGVLPLALAMPTSVLILMGFAARRRRQLR